TPLSAPCVCAPYYASPLPSHDLYTIVFYAFCPDIDLRSFPTRRSSDLDLAIAPVLRSDPLQNLQSVIELCRRILIGHDARRVTAAAEIDTDAGIAGTGELGVDRVIATGGHIVLAVGNVLENSGYSLVTEVFRQPDTGGEFDSVAQWDPRVFDDAYRSGVFAIAVGRQL